MNTIIKKITLLLTISSLIISSSFIADAKTKTAKEYLQQMSLEEKVAQMFIVEPDAHMGVSVVTRAGETTKESINKIPVGGFIYMEYNLVSKDQTREMLSNTQKYSYARTGLPMFLCVDEEGGTVARISGRNDYGVAAVENMSQVGAGKNYDRAYEIGKHLGKGISELGFNVDFAPVADVLTNSENTVVKKRSFGTDSKLVSEMSANVAKGLKENKVLATYKHFPGHGATSADTHKGFASTEKTLEQMLNNELVPFVDAAKIGIPMVMTAHIACPKVTGDYTPASLSKTMVTDVLRNKLGYKGLIVTDALNMGAIIQNYSSAEAAVKAIQAGNDILLMPYNFNEAYKGVLDAVRKGEISEARINESVERIINVKLGICAAQ